MADPTRIRLALYLGPGAHKLGTGKIRLLEAIGEHGSISAAARSLGMAYRHAWELVDDLDACFDRPAVETATGGRAGGGARLTAWGEELIRSFRAMEAAAARAVQPELAQLETHLAKRRTRTRSPKR